MKSAVIDSITRDPAHIRVIDKDVPQPGPGQILVKMRLSPVNPSDLNYLHGTYHEALQRIIWNQGQAGEVYFDPDRKKPSPIPPYTLGGEGVGIVEATGSGFFAKRLLGKRVAIAGGPPAGTWQEYVTTDAVRAVALPDSVSDEQGAMFFVNPVTAYVLVREVLKVPKGSWILITAAGSALGKSIVRMSKVYGFRTLCVVRSSAHSDELRSLGADAILETDSQDMILEVANITAGKGVGYAIDCIGGELAGQVVQCLGMGGKLVLYGTLANAPMSLTIRDLMMPVATISGFMLPNWMLQQSPLTLLKVLRNVKKLTVDGVFDTQVTDYYPLAEVAEAVSASMRSGRTGKVMLRIGSS